jgi:hypothetical protein
MAVAIQTRWTESEIEQAFDELAMLDLNSYDVTLRFGSSRQKEGLYFYSDIPLSKRLAEDLRSMVSKNLRPKLSSRKNADLVVRAYDPEAIPDLHEIVCEPAEDATDVMDYVAPLANLPIPDFDPKDKTFAKGLRCYVIVFSKLGHAPIYCFRHYTSRKILKTGGHSIFAIMNQGKYTRLESDALQIDDEIDCICWDKHIFIFDQDEYHKIFREGPHVKAAAQDALAILKEQDLIDSAQLESFLSSCMHDTRKRAKLRNIALKGRITADHLKDFDKLAQFLAEYPVKVRIVTVNGVKQLHYDKKGIWDMLKLLDDAYVISQLSGNRYVTGSRQQLD